MQQPAKRLLDSSLGGEIADQLGYDRHDPAGKNGGNSRNGTRCKKFLAEVGAGRNPFPATARGRSS
ncbi:hypothetical protein OHA44_17990 [Streptomyces sp. NBC_00144]|uniref:hypothetical protein n=1 Tax=Streptomyces sp. NBC_00144 TaxID=2975665 RepID=UPI0032487700